MRVISQDGTIDVPYEMVVIQRFKEDIYFLNRNLTGVEDLISDIRLAKYSTEAKAIKAMEMLKTSYKWNLAMGLMSEKARRVFANAESSMSNAEIMVDISKELTEFEYFQFPQDDEIEV
jgi:hypothetical protein